MSDLESRARSISGSEEGAWRMMPESAREAFRIEARERLGEPASGGERPLTPRLAARLQTSRGLFSVWRGVGVEFRATAVGSSVDEPVTAEAVAQFVLDLAAHVGPAPDVDDGQGPVQWYLRQGEVTARPGADIDASLWRGVTLSPQDARLYGLALIVAAKVAETKEET